MNTTLLQGRLGNQLFEYAFARAQSLADGRPCAMSEAPLAANGISNRLDCFRLSPDVQFVKAHRLTFGQRLALPLHARFIGGRERMLRHRREVMLKPLFARLGVFACEDGYTRPPRIIRGGNFLNIGFFQSERYFKDYKDVILDELQFRPEVKDAVRELALQITSSPEPTCLHVRLGDYVKNPLHGVADAAYYLRALAELKRLKPSATVFLFTDDVTLVRQQLHLDSSVTVIPSSVDEQQTMYLGSLCRNFLISNSSFSWWMQYLSQSDEKLVIAPSRWYAKPCPCDIFLKDWVLLDV